MAFIIDSFDKYDSFDQEHARFRFEINGNWYAIKEIEMKWGLPQLQVRMDYENDGKLHKIYESYEDAVEFVKIMKHLN